MERKTSRCVCVCVKFPSSSIIKESVHSVEYINNEEYVMWWVGLSQSVLASGVHHTQQRQQQVLCQDHLQHGGQREW